MLKGKNFISKTAFHEFFHRQAQIHPLNEDAYLISTAADPIQPDPIETFLAVNIIVKLTTSTHDREPNRSDLFEENDPTRWQLIGCPTAGHSSRNVASNWNRIEIIENLVNSVDGGLAIIKRIQEPNREFRGVFFKKSMDTWSMRIVWDDNICTGFDSVLECGLDRFA
jgi:hypothetical protein